MIIIILTDITVLRLVWCNHQPSLNIIIFHFSKSPKFHIFQYPGLLLSPFFLASPSSSTFKNTQISFKIGQEFDQDTPDGRKVKATITQKGNQLIEVQRGEKQPSYENSISTLSLWLLNLTILFELEFTNFKNNFHLHIIHAFLIKKPQHHIL